MKIKDIQLGGHYEAKVSGQLVEVVVFQGPFNGAGSVKPFFRVTNMKSGRILEMSAARLRRRILTGAEREAKLAAARVAAPFIDAALRGVSTGTDRRVSATRRGVNFLLGTA